jgi:Kef-type K+ transport system membrane component KefB
MHAVCAFVFLLAPTAAAAATAEGSTPLVLSTLALVLVVAKVAGYLASLARQPAVLGELLAGIVLGNLSLLGWHGFAPIAHDQGVALLAELGVILLLFEVGLESTVAEMRAVGLSSVLVALLGVVTPFALGFGIGKLLLPDASPYLHLFLGATLTATSVGITARILKDLNRARSREAKVILGAAVIDDVLGLVVLAVIVGLITAAGGGERLSLGAAGLILVKAIGFLAVALVAGRGLAPQWFRLPRGSRCPASSCPLASRSASPSHGRRPRWVSRPSSVPSPPGSCWSAGSTSTWRHARRGSLTAR